MESVDWYTNARPHSRLDYLTLVEFESAHYAQPATPTGAGLTPKPVPYP